MATNIPFSTASNINQFLLGIAAEEAANTKTKEKAIQKLESTVSKINTDIREAYDSLLPNVLVADVDTFTNLIANRIVNSPEKFFDNPKDWLDLTSDFSNTSSKRYLDLRKKVKELVGGYHQSLLSTQTSSNPIKDLNELSRKMFNRTRNIDNDVSARVLGLDFSKSIRKVFGNKSNLAVIDPLLGSSESTYVFFSSSFTTIGRVLTEKIYNPLITYLREELLGGTAETRSDITIGSVINLGHAALVNDIGSWVNTPSFAKSLFTVAKGGSQKFAPSQIREAASFFKKESRIVENKIQVSKKLTSIEEGYGILLVLSVTFTNFEDAVINSDRGREFEGPTAKLIGSVKATPLTTKQRETIVRKLYNTVLRTNPLLARSGKNILEFVEESVLNAIKGTKTASVKYKYQKTQRNTKTSYVPKNTKQIDKKYSKVPVKTASLDTPPKIVPNNLSQLKALLDRRLFEQIKANMGTGTSRDVLNYRTGRFANSVRVEKLTQSREGMITAFYSYMKNPYATFSQGGLQQFPRTRDPKLLISKSIREIAQTLVTNKLRAVNV